MKIFILTLFLYLLSSGAYASFIKLGWLNSDDELILRDNLSGLEWLNLSVTDNMTVNEIAGQYPTTTEINQPAGLYEGFRFATLEEVNELYSNFGITLVHGQAINTIAAYTAFDYLGTTTTIVNRYYDFYLQRGVVILNEGLINSMGIQTNLGGTTANAVVDYTERDFDFGDEDAGIFLVRSVATVPLPTAFWLFASCVISALGVSQFRTFKWNE